MIDDFDTQQHSDETLHDSYLDTDGDRICAPECDICAYCRDHTEFEYVDGAWLSVCCGARPLPVDVEPQDD